MKRRLIMMFFLVLAVSAALAQGKKAVPPPPKPADEGPSLEVTMKFIQDKLNGIGPVNYVVYLHDNVVGNDWTNQLKVEFTKVVANPGECRIGFHGKLENNGVVIQDHDAEFFLKDVKDIVVMLVEEGIKEGETAAGHPSWSVRVDPPIFVLKARTDDTEGNTFPFFDEQLANRVAKAMIHAVELCGETGTANKQEGEAFLAANRKKEGVVTLPSGLQYKILRYGTGPKPTASDNVVCNYRGTFINGTEFESSYKHGRPASFPVNAVIKGWTEALQLMPVGSKWQLFIPFDLAYGERGEPRGGIGPSATLIVEVELISITGQIDQIGSKPEPF
jgi:FKBP-type peptidyl-prolyl cis-trans isomerase